MGRTPKSDLPPELTRLLKQVGANLHALRQRSDLTQADLSDASGVSATTLNEIEKRRCRDIRLSTLVAIAKALDIHVLALLTEPNLKVTDEDRKKLLRASEDILRIMGRIQGDT